MTNQNKFITGLGMVLIAILWLGVVSYRSFVQNVENEALQRHTRLILEKLDVVLNDFLESEIVLRDYILAGDGVHIETYRDAIGQIGGHLDELRKLTADNPLQKGALERLGSLTREKLTDLENWVEVRQGGSSTAGF